MATQRRKPDPGPATEQPAWVAVSPHPAAEAARGDDDLMSSDCSVRTDRRRMRFVPFADTRAVGGAAVVFVAPQKATAIVGKSAESPQPEAADTNARAVAIDQVIRRHAHRTDLPTD